MSEDARHDRPGIRAHSPAELEQCFASWVSGVCPVLAGRMIAINGKARRYRARAARFAPSVGLRCRVRNDLGATPLRKKSNEITAIQALLPVLAPEWRWWRSTPWAARPTLPHRLRKPRATTCWRPKTTSCSWPRRCESSSPRSIGPAIRCAARTASGRSTTGIDVLKCFAASRWAPGLARHDGSAGTLAWPRSPASNRKGTSARRSIRISATPSVPCRSRQRGSCTRCVPIGGRKRPVPVPGRYVRRGCQRQQSVQSCARVLLPAPPRHQHDSCRHLLRDESAEQTQERRPESRLPRPSTGTTRHLMLRTCVLPTAEDLRTRIWNPFLGGVRADRTHSKTAPSVMSFAPTPDVPGRSNGTKTLLGRALTP